MVTSLLNGLAGAADGLGPGWAGADAVLAGGAAEALRRHLAGLPRARLALADPVHQHLTRLAISKGQASGMSSVRCWEQNYSSRSRQCSKRGSPWGPADTCSRARTGSPG